MKDLKNDCLHSSWEVFNFECCYKSTNWSYFYLKMANHSCWSAFPVNFYCFFWYHTLRLDIFDIKAIWSQKLPWGAGVQTYNPQFLFQIPYWCPNCPNADINKQVILLRAQIRIFANNLNFQLSEVNIACQAK